jgi:hypothetical protein
MAGRGIPRKLYLTAKVLAIVFGALAFAALVALGVIWAADGSRGDAILAFAWAPAAWLPLVVVLAFGRWVSWLAAVDVK